MRYKVSGTSLSRTFEYFRRCGRGQRECQALWISDWRFPETITDVIHPSHRAHAQGFSLDDGWLNAFWLHLANTNNGIRVQVHTHPNHAFHSPTDDAFPIIHTPGFLSLVIQILLWDRLVSWTPTLPRSQKMVLGVRFNVRIAWK